MITVATPAFLVAGGLLAAIPVLLHLLSRRPPGRAALPTARFLAEDPRTLLRVRRTPSDLSLLALRVLFALALGAAFAGLRWVPEREGTRQVILLDAGADSLVAWAALTDAVGEVAAGAGAAAPSASGEGDREPSLVIAYGLDDGARVIAAAEVGQLTRGSGPATLEDGLRALRREAARARFAEAEVTWVGRPSWRVWSPAVGLLRPALWPGRLHLRAVDRTPPRDSTADFTGDATPGVPPSAAPPSEGGAGPLARVAVGSSGAAVERAVAALGGRIMELADSSPDVSPDWIVLETARQKGLEPWLPQVSAGAALLAFGEPPTDSPDLLWTAPPARNQAPDPALLLLPGDRAVGAVVPRTPGHPAPGARTLLTFDDGAPAAAARDVGEGCVVFVAAPLTDPVLTASAAYPELLRTLLLGCRTSGFGDGPLDRGAVQALERPDLPATVEVAAILSPEGRPWTRWLLLAALTFLGLEVALTRSAGRHSPRPGTATRAGAPS